MSLAKLSKSNSNNNNHENDDDNGDEWNKSGHITNGRMSRLSVQTNKRMKCTGICEMFVKYECTTDLFALELEIVHRTRMLARLNERCMHSIYIYIFQRQSIICKQNGFLEYMLVGMIKRDSRSRSLSIHTCLRALSCFHCSHYTYTHTCSLIYSTICSMTNPLVADWFNVPEIADRRRPFTVEFIESSSSSSF